MFNQLPLWRGSLLPLEREAVAIRLTGCVRQTAIAGFGAASQPSGSKLPHHNRDAEVANYA
ncbi:hypothetical protein PS723_00603 [Pseudomonas fluorescens]|uniref:Uncharacterized protein n=1 Tax=Pseudomonas fluorescens TaxID=294 RepID=A0A5E7A784_PSEFL|nr:hypothetical protein PS723_00603 [Pseudomonas fluorescens]